MASNLTIQDLFALILFLLGIGALIYLILVLKNINRLLCQAKLLTESNMKELDTTIKQLPEISENINAITKETRTTLNKLTPEIDELLHNINSISGKVESATEAIDNTTHKIVDTVDVLADSISETAIAIKYNVKDINTYIQIFKEILEFIKKALKKQNPLWVLYLWHICNNLDFIIDQGLIIDILYIIGILQQFENYYDALGEVENYEKSKVNC